MIVSISFVSNIPVQIERGINASGGRRGEVTRIPYFNKTYQAAVDRYDRLRRRQGIKGLWTRIGLWTSTEDDVIRNHMAAPGDRVPLGTWPEVALHLDRTARAVRTRACYLRQADHLAGTTE